MTPQAQHCIAFTLAQEGGLVDDPQDPGGLTNWGIALKRHPELGAQWIRQCTRQQAMEWYAAQVWPAIRGDDLPLPLALLSFDAAVNSGAHRAGLWLQAALDVPADGHVGPATLAAARNCDLRAAISAFSLARLRFLQALPTWPRFGHGWVRRIDQTQQAALAAIGAA
jgi:lysozyme family protein